MKVPPWKTQKWITKHRKSKFSFVVNSNVLNGTGYTCRICRHCYSTFMMSCFLSCKTSTFWKQVNSKRKELALKCSKILPFSSRPPCRREIIHSWFSPKSRSPWSRLPQSILRNYSKARLCPYIFTLKFTVRKCILPWCIGPSAIIPCNKCAVLVHEIHVLHIEKRDIPQVCCNGDEPSGFCKGDIYLTSI